MPEGPEIRRAADRIAKVLVGHPLTQVVLNHEAFTGYDHVFDGATVTDVTTRGKAMLTSLSSGITIYSHNQLYGVWIVSARGEQPQTARQPRLTLMTDDHEVVLYSATDISVWSSNEVLSHAYLQKLGPDVLDEATTTMLLSQRLKHPRFQNRSLATLYLDQAFLAGIGNYLRSEILFKAQCHPDDKPSRLKESSVRQLARESIEISRRSYRTGGVTNTAGRAKKLKRTGASFEQYRFFVFERDGLPCYCCETPIVREDRGARRVYWCPGCQAKRV